MAMTEGDHLRSFGTRLVGAGQTRVEVGVGANGEKLYEMRDPPVSDAEIDAFDAARNERASGSLNAFKMQYAGTLTCPDVVASYMIANGIAQACNARRTFALNKWRERVVGQVPQETTECVVLKFDDKFEAFDKKKFRDALLTIPLPTFAERNDAVASAERLRFLELVRSGK